MQTKRAPARRGLRWVHLWPLLRDHIAHHRSPGGTASRLGQARLHLGVGVRRHSPVGSSDGPRRGELHRQAPAQANAMDREGDALGCGAVPEHVQDQRQLGACSHVCLFAHCALVGSPPSLALALPVEVPSESLIDTAAMPVVQWGNFLEYRLRELDVLDRKLLDAIKVCKTRCTA